MSEFALRKRPAGSRTDEVARRTRVKGSLLDFAFSEGKRCATTSSAEATGRALQKRTEETWKEASETFKAEYYSDGHRDGYKLACQHYIDSPAAFSSIAKAKLGFHPGRAPEPSQVVRKHKR